jgi:transcriptional regulator with XRE-family HTH domain
MNEELAALGVAIRRVRKTLNISQTTLGELCGLHRTYICAVESGVRNVTFLSLVKLARALNTTVSEIIRDAEAASSRGHHVRDAADARSARQKRGSRDQLRG